MKRICSTRLRWGLAVLAVGASGCSASLQAFTPPPDEIYDPAVVESGEGIYLRVCATCHGRVGDGGTGPNIRQVWERLAPAEHLEIVVIGRNEMPAFGRSLSEEDVAAVVAYQRVGWPDPPG